MSEILMPVIDQEPIEAAKEKNKIDELWKQSQQNVLLERIKAGENMQSIVESLDGFEEAFSKELSIIACSDERVSVVGGKVGLAGSLVLADADEWRQFVEMNKGKITEVTSHDECGAAQACFKNDDDGYTSPEQLGKSKAEQLAEALGAKYSHISKDSMRSVPIHDARTICLDGTGRFNPGVMLEMPQTFVASGPGFDMGGKYVQSELQALINIAFSSHGFGSRFTTEDPFRVIISAKDKQQLEDLTWLAEEAVGQFGDRVVVEGFIKNV